MIRTLRRFRRDETGAALVEFGLLLPTLVLFLGLCVEGGRTFWSYQATIAGVRDAARYLSRAAEADICTTGGSTAPWNARLAQIVRETQSGESLFPQAVTVASVSSSLACVGAGHRTGAAPVATVTATLRIGYPFSGLFALAGVTVTEVTTTVTDRARVVGS